MIEFLKGRFPIAAYCPPNPEVVFGGRKFPSAVNDLQYDRMRELGINLVFGSGEGIGTPQEKEVFIAMELCARRNMFYLPTDQIAREYCSNGAELPLWQDLSEAKKKDLDERFEKSLQRYSKNAGFGGIFFCDEPGAVAFPAIAAAQKVFRRICPDKLFYVNMFGYCVTPAQFTYGNMLAKVEPEDCFAEEPKERRYANFVKRYLQQVHPEIYSYDFYPMVTLGGIRTAVHAGMYELFNLTADCIRASEKEIPLWCFLQAGGRWENSLNVRVPNAAEILLQVNVLIALGAKGLEIFPYYFPACWADDPNVEAGLVDVDGNLTDLWHYYYRAFRPLLIHGEFFGSAKYKGYLLSGKYCGLLPDEGALSTVLWNDCIYRGDLKSGIRIEHFSPLLRVESTTELIVGCFEGECPGVFAVNNSITNMLNATFYLECPQHVEIWRGYRHESKISDILCIDALEAGDAVFILFKGKEV